MYRYRCHTIRMNLEGKRLHYHRNHHHRNQPIHRYLKEKRQQSPRFDLHHDLGIQEESRINRIDKDNHRCCPLHHPNPSQPILVHRREMDRRYRQRRLHLYQRIL